MAKDLETEMLENQAHGSTGLERAIYMSAVVICLKFDLLIDVLGRLATTEIAHEPPEDRIL